LKNKRESEGAANRESIHRISVYYLGTLHTRERQASKTDHAERKRKRKRTRKRTGKAEEPF